MENSGETYERVVQIERCNNQEADYEAPHLVVNEVVVTSTEFVSANPDSISNVTNLQNSNEIQTNDLDGLNENTDVTCTKHQNIVNIHPLDSTVTAIQYMPGTISGTELICGDKEILCGQTSNHYVKEVGDGTEKNIACEHGEVEKYLINNYSKLAPSMEDNFEKAEGNGLIERNVELGAGEVKAVNDPTEKKCTQLENVNIKSHIAETSRNVIQEIFDDWQDENVEDDASTTCKEQDSVEMELQNLLNDNSIQTEQQNYINLCNFSSKVKKIPHPPAKQVKNDQVAVTFESDQLTNSRASFLSNSKSPVDSAAQNQFVLKNKPMPSRSSIQVPGLHLTSQIATKNDITGQLLEKNREKQKDVVMPVKAVDNLFVKKMSQRLSSKLTAVPVCSNLPLLSSLQPKLVNATKSVMNVSNSNTADNTDLLAILEGDVDPDWSYLKSESAPMEDSGKINPNLAKEIALKQLLELPKLPAKKSVLVMQNKKRSLQQSESEVKERQQVVKSTEKVQRLEKISHEEDQRHSFLREDESRSGRKRKLTEKFRDIEQSLIKKQKRVERKVDFTTNEDDPHINSCRDNASPKPKQKKETITGNESVQINSLDTNIIIDDKLLDASTSGDKHPKLNISNKDMQVSKRKVTGKSLFKQKLVRKKSSSMSKSSQAFNEDSVEHKPAKAKPRKINEIDRLLQDEGVVNMLYDTEQFDGIKKRYIPITKTHKTTLDMDKVEREWRLRNKFVKNALMRARNSSLPSTVSSARSRRSAMIPEQSGTNIAKVAAAASKSPKVMISEGAVPTEFIMPGKIRNAADASRIIRRHSSSSFSSASASPRVSIDAPMEGISSKIDETELEVHIRSKPLSTRTRKKSGSKELVNTNDNGVKSQYKKEIRRKSAGKGDTTVSDLITKVRKMAKKKTFQLDSSRSNLEENFKNEAIPETNLFNVNRKKGSVIHTKENNVLEVNSKKMFSGSNIKVKKIGNLVQLLLAAPEATSDSRNTLTIAMMQDFLNALEILESDITCKVVLFITSGTTFCDGLDLSYVLQSGNEERKAKSTTLANSVKNFLRALANFKKPIVAGVQGAAKGLGVTMLPLFDLVIASDKATFCTDYGRLGQIAEGTACLTLTSHGRSAINELLIGNRTLTASEALRAGIVTRVLWPDKYQGELLPTVKALSTQSSQSMMAMKSLLRKSLHKNLDIELEAESEILIDQWCSFECQQLIRIQLEKNSI